MHYLTEANLRDPRVLKEITRFVNRMEAKVEESGEALPTNVEVVLELGNDEWEYYMIDHNLRAPFWLDEFDATWMADEINGIENKAQLSASLFEFG